MSLETNRAPVRGERLGGEREGDRRRAIAVLVRGCHRLMLQPHDAEAQAALVAVLATARVAEAEVDSLLVAALVKEAAAHADELALRLDSPGYSALYIGATAARLCQTLNLLQRQLGSDVVASRRLLAGT